MGGDKAMKRAKKAKKKRRREADGDESDGAVAQLDGVMLDGALYLVDKAAGVVYSSERDAEGELVRAGAWDAGEGRATLEEAPEGPDKEPKKKKDKKKKKKKKKEKEAEEEEPRPKKGKKRARDAEEEEAGGGGDEAEAKKSKSQRRKSALPTGGVELPPADAEYPFEVDKDDHCESPFEAYRDVAGLLEGVAAQLGKTRATLQVYDPYYCAGGVKKHLAKLGFESVRNRKEDFYAVQARGEVPDYDVLVTNPPYSADHVQRILRFCVRSRKPWLILQPNYVYQKDYYLEELKATNARPFYICPSGARYHYYAPDGRTSPFVSFWYCDLGRFRAAALQKWRGSGSQAVYANNLWKLPANMRDSRDPLRKKKRKKKKKKGAAAA